MIIQTTLFTVRVHFNYDRHCQNKKRALAALSYDFHILCDNSEGVDFDTVLVTAPASNAVHGCLTCTTSSKDEATAIHEATIATISAHHSFVHGN